MDSLMPILLLSLCASAYSEPLPEALQRRSDMFGVYASEYAREYEPVAYAAVPLHSPIPVLHIISPVPLPLKQPHHTRADPQRQQAQSAPRPTYAHPYPHMYAASLNSYMYTNQPTEPAPTILYARPNPQGGYTYRRRPSNRNPPKRSTAPSREPVIIRVHKYRIIRER